ncbi:MAG TPA: TIM-barrel domain-containing protein [Acidimicrobiales bacterium]
MLVELRAGRLLLQLDDRGLLSVADDERGVLLGPLDDTPAAKLGGVGVQRIGDVSPRRSRSGPVLGPGGPDDELAPPIGTWDAVERATETATTTHSFTATLVTSAGSTVTVSAHAVRDDVVDLTLSSDHPETVEALGVAWACTADERWLGFGERSDAFQRTQGDVECYVGEGPYQSYEYPFLEGIVPPWGMRQRLDATYFPLPWLLSTNGWGLALHNDDLSYFRLRPDGLDQLAVEIEAATLSLRIYGGPTPLDALRHYTDDVGRQPEPPARWAFGPWYQTGHANHVPLEEERRQAEMLRAAGVPVSAAETHCRHLPLGEHRGHEASERARTELLHGFGLAVLSYLNPLLGIDYADVFARAEADDALLRHADGSTYVFEAYVGGREPPHTQETQFDFFVPAATDRFADVAAELVASGYDGWMEDFGEDTPLDACDRDGAPLGTAGHNAYATAFHQAAADAAGRLEAQSGRPLVRFVRSGFTGTAPHVPLVWGGDPTTGWGFDGLASSLVEGLSMGASGIALWGSDIGGFLSSEQHLTPELLIRWIQFGALSPLMRTKSSGIELPPYRRPQVWDDDVLPHFQHWCAWHTQLNDYLLAAHEDYRTNGRPIMCAMALDDPDGPAADALDQFWLGRDLLCAPVLEDGARDRTLTVPHDGMIELWRAVGYDPVRRAHALTGAGTSARHDRGIATLAAPLDEVPILVRPGTLLSLLPPEVDTLAPYGETVRRVDDVTDRVVLAFPSASWSGRLGPGLMATSVVTDGKWLLDLSAEGGRRMRVEADLGVLPGGAPDDVDVRGAAAQQYDPTTGIFHAEVGTGRLEVSPAGTTRSA